MVEAHTDGKYYGLSDMVKAGSCDCRGCSACCRGMGDSICLDPWDLYQIMEATGKNVEELLQKEIALTVVDGMILPTIKMDEKKDCCSFLLEERCSIHNHRPGLCRLFPLGRNFENGVCNYILLKDTCDREMVKVKVSKWIGVSDVGKYETFVTDWHYFARTMKEILMDMEEAQAKNCNLFLLHTFYLTPYDPAEDFYDAFYARLHKIKSQLGLS